MLRMKRASMDGSGNRGLMTSRRKNAIVTPTQTRQMKNSLTML